MVPVTVRQEAGPRERWPKMLKGEFKNNSRKPRDPALKTTLGSQGTWHNDSLQKLNMPFLRVRRRRKMKLW
jgi:hypothetical protein